MPLDLHSLVPGRRIEPEEPVVLRVSKEIADAEVTNHGGRSTFDVVDSLPRRRYGVQRGHLYLMPDGTILSPQKDAWTTNDTDEAHEFVNCTVITNADGTSGLIGRQYGVSAMVAELEVAREIIIAVDR